MILFRNFSLNALSRQSDSYLLNLRHSHIIIIDHIINIMKKHFVFICFPVFSALSLCSSFHFSSLYPVVGLFILVFVLSTSDEKTGFHSICSMLVYIKYGGFKGNPRNTSFNRELNEQITHKQYFKRVTGICSIKKSADSKTKVEK